MITFCSRGRKWVESLSCPHRCQHTIAYSAGVRSLLSEQHSRSSLTFVFLVLAGLLGSCTPLGYEIVYPLNAPRIFSDYGDFSSPGGRRESRHEGMDIEGRLGDRWGGIGAPVLAAADGIVIRSHWSNNSGYRIVIEHGADEDGKYLRTEYLHHSEILVSDGDRVERGQQIARSGHTGAYRGRDPHLHFAVYRGDRSSNEWTHVDPHEYWYDGRYRVTCFDPERYYRTQPIRFTYPIQCKQL